MSKTARCQIDRRAGSFRRGWRASSPGRDDNTFRNRPTPPASTGAYPPGRRRSPCLSGRRAHTGRPNRRPPRSARRAQGLKHEPHAGLRNPIVTRRAPGSAPGWFRQISHQTRLRTPRSTLEPVRKVELPDSVDVWRLRGSPLRPSRGHAAHAAAGRGLLLDGRPAQAAAPRGHRGHPARPGPSRRHRRSVDGTHRADGRAARAGSRLRTDEQGSQVLRAAVDGGRHYLVRRGCGRHREGSDRGETQDEQSGRDQRARVDQSSFSSMSSRRRRGRTRHAAGDGRGSGTRAGGRARRADRRGHPESLFGLRQDGAASNDQVDVQPSVLYRHLGGKACRREVADHRRRARIAPASREVLDQDPPQRGSGRQVCPRMSSASTVAGYFRSAHPLWARTSGSV